MEQRSGRGSGEPTEDNQESDGWPGKFRNVEAYGLARTPVLTKSGEEPILDAHFHLMSLALAGTKIPLLK